MIKIREFATIRISNHVHELGGKIYRGPLRIEDARRTIAQIQDPFGNVIGLEAEF
jgi:predicted enzyme related to lactoylglutathione lyase